jgi:hypothetical protein
MVQTFLWWANVATKVHELYQSFFPPDVQGIADHAKRATSRYPVCDGKYYGVDYAARGREGVPHDELQSRHVPSANQYPANDLSWYANIPVPTSYMCVGSRGDFLADTITRRRRDHSSPHHIRPGKTVDLGQSRFRLRLGSQSQRRGSAVRRAHGRRVHDNQPDFSFLMPGETKSFSQYWYPIRQIGPADSANLEAACSIRVDRDRARIGIAVTSAMEIEAVLRAESQTLWRVTATLSPDQPLIQDDLQLPLGVSRNDLEELKQGERTILEFAPGAIRPARSLRRHRTAFASGHRQQRRAAHDRAASGAISPRHALARTLLA